ncbi:MAG: hypothetical protein ACYDCD_12290 [Candidatus Acidiferrales bacterium]
MNEKRRIFLAMMVPGAVLASAANLGARERKPLHDFWGQFPQGPPPTQSPAVPSGFPKPTKAELTANQKEIRKDVDRLFSLAQDLKEEAGKTDTVIILSVAFVEKTREIEKLAKRIRDLARD